MELGLRGGRAWSPPPTGRSISARRILCPGSCRRCSRLALRASHALEDWAYQRVVQLDFIRPGKPVEHAHIESFNGRLRDESLNVHQFVSLEDARQKIEAWRCDYNDYRPHSSLGHL